MSGVQKVQKHHFCQKRMAILKASLYRTKAEIDFLHRTHEYQTGIKVSDKEYNKIDIGHRTSDGNERLELHYQGIP